MKITKTIILMIFAILLLSIPVLSYQMQSYSRPTYNNQYTYTHNSRYYGMGHVPITAYGSVGNPYFAPTYGRAIFGFETSSCSNFGCRNVQTAHMAINNQLDYAYYSNPSLLEPRSMNSQSRVVPRNYYYGGW